LFLRSQELEVAWIGLIERVMLVQEAKDRPTIGVMGSGAIGGFYGVMLARAGFAVHFLLRSDYEVVARNGFRLRSRMYGDVNLKAMHIYRRVEDMPKCDWILVSTKTTGNLALAPKIAECAAPGAHILVLQNGMDVEDQIRAALPESMHVVGGVCYVCAQRTAPGVIEHLALAAVHLGYHSGPATTVAEKQAILTEGASLFRDAGVEAETVSNLSTARWRKLLSNVPFNGLSVLLKSELKQLASNRDSSRLALDMMRELMACGEKLGYRLPSEMPQRAVTQAANIPDYWPSMYQDYINCRPMELDAIYAAPLAAAAGAGCSMPKVEALYQALRFIDTHNRSKCSERERQDDSQAVLVS
jgi:2-dehydropantoate 2-reductase